MENYFYQLYVVTIPGCSSSAGAS